MASEEGRSTAERSLVSLAMLKVRYDTGQQDYLDHLYPFVANVLPKKGERINSLDVSNRVREDFALEIPLQVIETLLKRLTKRRYVRKELGSYYVEQEIADKQLSARQEVASSEIHSVIDVFRQHVKENFGRDLSNDEASIAIVGFVRKFAVDCLQSFSSATPIPSVKLTRGMDVWFASFVNAAAAEQNETWPHLTTLFESILLANAFTCPDTDIATANFEDVIFYLDTPLVLSLLGFQGEYEERKAQELCRLIGRLQGRLAVFEHTIDEVSSVLKYVELHIDSQENVNKIVRYFQEKNRTASDVALAAAELDVRLKRLHVQTRSTPDYDERYQIDETALEGSLHNRIGYNNPKAVQYDINSVRSIYVLRQGKNTSKLERCGAIFVTTNANFATTAFEYSKRFEFTKEISPVMTDFALANICWLKKPIESGNLAQISLLASTVAALRPTESQWMAYLAEVKSLRESGSITAAQETLARTSLKAQDYLIQLTDGADADLGPKVTLEVVKMVEAQITAPLHEAIKLEKIERAGLESRLNDVEVQNHATDDRRRLKLDGLATFIGALVEYSIGVIVIVGGSIGLYASYTGQSVKSLGIFFSAFAMIVGFALLLFTLFGWTKRVLSVVVHNAVYTKLCKLLDLESKQ